MPLYMVSESDVDILVELNEPTFDNYRIKGKRHQKMGPL